jgi:hypothetical protein
MYEVWVTAIPAKEVHTLERVFRKNNRGPSDKEIHDRALRAGKGEAVLLRSLQEKEAAEHLVKEVMVHGGTAEIREPSAS